MKINTISKENNQTNFYGGFYKSHRIANRPSNLMFDKKILARLASLTKDKVQKAKLRFFSIPHLVLKNGTDIYFSPHHIEVTNKDFHQKKIYPDGEITYYVPYTILKQDAEETGGVLPNVIESWHLREDADNTNEFLSACANLLGIFKQLWKF